MDGTGRLDHTPFTSTANNNLDNCVTQLKLDTVEKLSSSIFCCLCVCEASVTPDQISTFSNIYRHTSPLLTLYHLISSSTNLNWSSTSQYRHIRTQYHQVPLIINHLVRDSSVNLKISHFTTHLMSHAQYTWSSFPSPFLKQTLKTANLIIHSIFFCSHMYRPSGSDHVLINTERFWCMTHKK